MPTSPPSKLSSVHRSQTVRRRCVPQNMVRTAWAMAAPATMASDRQTRVCACRVIPSSPNDRRRTSKYNRYTWFKHSTNLKTWSHPAGCVGVPSCLRERGLDPRPVRRMHNRMRGTFLRENAPRSQIDQCAHVDQLLRPSRCENATGRLKHSKHLTNGLHPTADVHRQTHACQGRCV